LHGAARAIVDRRGPFRASSRQKIAKILSTKSFPFRERRASHADQTRDLRRHRGRPGFIDGVGAGQELGEKFRGEDAERAIGFVITLQRAAGNG
jgi:hypothetical protein